jgi:hypothetical protein
MMINNEYVDMSTDAERQLVYVAMAQDEGHDVADNAEVLIIEDGAMVQTRTGYWARLYTLPAGE